jgi:hypothetical protein
MNWQQLVEFLGGATAISVVLGYLGKRAKASEIIGLASFQPSPCDECHNRRYCGEHETVCNDFRVYVHFRRIVLEEPDAALRPKVVRGKLPQV